MRNILLTVAAMTVAGTTATLAQTSPSPTGGILNPLRYHAA
jgi:hypothetical protein